MASSTDPIPVRPGDPTSPDEQIARLVRKHQRGVGAFLETLGCPAELVEDFVQETFVAVLRGGWPDAGQAEPSGAWLRSVAKNRFVDHLRRTKAQLLVDVDDVDLAWHRFDQADDGATYLEALRACLEALEEPVRHLVELRYRDGLDRAQLCSASGLTLGGVKARLARAKVALRICIERKLA